MQARILRLPRQSHGEQALVAIINNSDIDLNVTAAGKTEKKYARTELRLAAPAPDSTTVTTLISRTPTRTSTLTLPTYSAILLKWRPSYFFVPFEVAFTLVDIELRYSGLTAHVPAYFRDNYINLVPGESRAPTIEMIIRSNHD